MLRKFLTAIFFLVGCSKPEPSTPGEHRDTDLRHPGGAGGRMDFAPPKDAPDEFWCEDDAMPETKAGAGSCYRTAEECRHISEHLWTQYNKPMPVPACTKKRHAHCFDMVSRGTPYEVCRSTARGCAAHHEQQTRDAWVDKITDSCEER